ncbi:nucleotidyl transferase AbiEii/AbiGii toxin family protein [Sphingopyxis macrogoltabida]|uniref:Nucleotidyl transferase AbiEii/AbiGii toxin family protein n=1 Tax=Sphingopyxis macrogoltabida TaxID=33050 RepID=A0AAC9AZ81_SPHMC|nr:nucleotidyl transferase AbiEii/AbiGii toxin family protein [Sphingopyxis macrogoltabida]ALJ16269.1 hypothetical protein LH19_26065 [Sphingopyxis macrogoltabida]AMU92507.1 hypothetical protein ATM17_30065 [Sphingopyxis macrogoltabida]
MIELIREKLDQANTETPVGRENALKQILQEIALYALWRADFFDVALFQGGTSLRILHGLPRFSEDLDFILREPDSAFDWSPYLKVLADVFDEYGLDLEVKPRDRMDTAIREAVLKDNSIARQLDLKFVDRGLSPAIKIKLEIDTNPPSGSGEATSFLDFPLDYLVRHQDLESNFALKVHALLCRGFLKGRDWFDFSWYVSKGVTPNLPLLQSALMQTGPWVGEGSLAVDMRWLREVLRSAIMTIDWGLAFEDVRRFLRPEESKMAELWSEDFFLAKVDKLKDDFAN